MGSATPIRLCGRLEATIEGAAVAERPRGTQAGIVTAIEVELHPVTTVDAGVMAWDADRAAEVIPAWIEWAHGAPDAVTSVLRGATMPDGRRVVLIACELRQLGGALGGAFAAVTDV